MRSFILGLLVGGLAVHLWHRASRSRSSRLEVTRSSFEPVTESMPPRAESFSPPPAAPPASGAPNYEAAALSEYSIELQAIADRLFERTASLVGRARSQKHDNGYSFLWESGATAAKIIVYQRRRGKESGTFPMLQDGVYLLLRTRASAPNTLGITPDNEVRFNYRRVSEADVEELADGIADMLHAADVVLR